MTDKHTDYDEPTIGWSTHSHIPTCIGDRYAEMYISSCTHRAIILTHWVRVTHKHHWFRWLLAAWSASSHYRDQCWNSVNSNHRNKLLWKLLWKRNSYIFIQENAFGSRRCTNVINQHVINKNQPNTWIRSEKKQDNHNLWYENIW